MSPRGKGPDDDGSSLDDVPEEEVEQFEEGVDTEDLDEDELVSLDDAARSLLAKPRKGHGPIARLYRGETRFDFVGKRSVWFAISTVIILLGVSPSSCAEGSTSVLSSRAGRSGPSPLPTSPRPRPPTPWRAPG